MTAKVCGQPNSLQIRSYVSQSGIRVPASSSRYSRIVMPKRHAAGLLFPRFAESPSVRSERRLATTGTTDQPVREGVVLFVLAR